MVHRCRYCREDLLILPSALGDIRICPMCDVVKGVKYDIPKAHLLRRAWS